MKIEDKWGYIDTTGRVVIKPQYEKEPKPARLGFPEYPEKARKSGAEGTVWVKIWISKKGKPIRIIIFKSSNDVFNAAAINAARQSVYTPAMKNNEPVDVWLSVPFDFRLK